MFFLNTGGVALVAAALLILMVVLFRKWKGHSHMPGQYAKAIIVFGPYIALVIVIGNIMLGDLQRPSTVDVAPFLALEDIDVGDAAGQSHKKAKRIPQGMTACKTNAILFK